MSKEADAQYQSKQHLSNDILEETVREILCAS